MNTAYLLLGSNLGDRVDLLDKACQMLEGKGAGIIRYSSLYETEPWGNAAMYESEKVYNFLNRVLKIETELEPLELLKVLREIEAELGRKKKAGNSKQGEDNAKLWDNRTIDIDILFYNNFIQSSGELILPHPHIADRKFVLEPLNEIAADYVHPVLKKTISELAKESNDKGEVFLFKG